METTSAGILFDPAGRAKTVWAWHTNERTCPYSLEASPGDTIVHLDSSTSEQDLVTLSLQTHALTLAALDSSLVASIDTVPDVTTPKSRKLVYQPGYRRLAHQPEKVKPVVRAGPKDSFPALQVVHVFEPPVEVVPNG